MKKEKFFWVLKQVYQFPKWPKYVPGSEEEGSPHVVGEKSKIKGGIFDGLGGHNFGYFNSILTIIELKDLYLWQYSRNQIILNGHLKEMRGDIRSTVDDLFN